MPASIDAHCGADVTHTLQAWLDGTPDDSVISFPSRACYRIEGTLSLGRRRKVHIEGHGTTLKATTVGQGSRLAVRGRSQLAIGSSQDVVVRDLIVRGANPKAGTSDAAYVPRFEAQHGFSLSGDDGVTLDHVQAYDVYGDFVYIGGANGVPSTHIVVRDSHFERNGRQGISVTDGTDIDIVNNTIGAVSRSLIDLEPNVPSQEVRRIRIEHNVTGPVHNFWLADKGVGFDIGDITVSDNVMNAPSGGLVFVFGPARHKRGPFAFTHNRFQVSGLVSDEGATGAFVFVNASGVQIAANVVTAPAARRMPAVELRGSDHVVVSGNRFAGTSKPVLADGASRDVSVS